MTTHVSLTLAVPDLVVFDSRCFHKHDFQLKPRDEWLPLGQATFTTSKYCRCSELYAGVKTPLVKLEGVKKPRQQQLAAALLICRVGSQKL